MTSTDLVVNFVIVVCLQQLPVGYGSCVGVEQATDDAFDTAHQQRLDQLVVVGADTNDIVCGRCHDTDRGASSDDCQRSPALQRLVDTGYRFFDLSVVEVMGIFYWRTASVDSCLRRREISHCGREISDDLRLMATLSAKHNSELFFLRLTIDDVAMATRSIDGSQGGRRASIGRKLLRVVLREFNVRLIRSSLVTDYAATFVDVPATGSNVAVFVNNLNEFLRVDTSHDNDTALNEFFITDDKIVREIIKTTHELHLRNDDVISAVPGGSGGVLRHTLVRLSPDCGDVGGLETCAYVCSWFTLCVIGAGQMVIVFAFFHTKFVTSLPVPVCIRLKISPPVTSSRVFLRLSKRLAADSNTDRTCTYHRKLIISKATKSFLITAASTLGLLLFLSTSTRNAKVPDNDIACNDVAQGYTRNLGLTRGLTELIKRRLSHPGLYHINVISLIHPGMHSTSCFSVRCSCQSAIDTSIFRLVALANAGQIYRLVSLYHAGTPLTGVVGFRSFFVCPPVLFAYAVTSRDEGHVITWNQLREGESREFREAEFPMDSNVIVYVGTVWNRWLQIYEANIQQLIEAGLDIYLRGTESRSGIGLAFVSHRRHHTSKSCRKTPYGGLLNSTRWDDRLSAVEERQKLDV